MPSIWFEEDGKPPEKIYRHDSLRPVSDMAKSHALRLVQQGWRVKGALTDFVAIHPRSGKRVSYFIEPYSPPSKPANLRIDGPRVGKPVA